MCKWAGVWSTVAYMGTVKSSFSDDASPNRTPSMAIVTTTAVQTQPETQMPPPPQDAFSARRRLSTPRHEQIRSVGGTLAALSRRGRDLGGERTNPHGVGGTPLAPEA